MKLKRKYLMPATFCVIVAMAFSFIKGKDAVYKLDGGPPYNTKAPGEKTCSGGEGTSLCHGGGIPDNAGPGTPSITFSGGSVYVPGQTYTVTITITHPLAGCFGFQIVSLDDNTNMFTGSITLLDTAKTRMQQPTWGSAQDRIYVMHRIAGTTPTTPGQGQWSYQWTAPSTNVGNISFYSCNVAGNNNALNDSGDETYWKKITISPSAVGIDHSNPQAFELSVFPNPVNESINLSYTLQEPGLIEADLLDMHGRVVQSLLKAKAESFFYNEKVRLAGDVADGVYLVRTRINGKEFLKKVCVQ